MLIFSYFKNIWVTFDQHPLLTLFRLSLRSIKVMNERQIQLKTSFVYDFRLNGNNNMEKIMLSAWAKDANRREEMKKKWFRTFLGKFNLIPNLKRWYNSLLLQDCFYSNCHLILQFFGRSRSIFFSVAW